MATEHKLPEPTNKEVCCPANSKDHQDSPDKSDNNEYDRKDAHKKETK